MIRHIPILKALLYEVSLTRIVQLLVGGKCLYLLQVEHLYFAESLVRLVNVVEEMVVVGHHVHGHDFADVRVGFLVAERLVQLVVYAEQVVINYGFGFESALAYDVALRVGRSTCHWFVQTYAFKTQMHEIDEAHAERREYVE